MSAPGPLEDKDASVWIDMLIAMVEARGLDALPFGVNKRTPVEYGAGSILQLLLRHPSSEHRNNMCSVLLYAGASPLLQDVTGTSAIHLAALEGSVLLLTSMLSAAQEAGHMERAVTHTTSIGCTALHMAAAGGPIEGRIDACESLIMCSAQVSAVSTVGEMPIHMAARAGDAKAQLSPSPVVLMGVVQVCKLLVECGADVNAVVEGGTQTTALHLALEYVPHFEYDVEKRDQRAEWYLSSPQMAGVQCCIQLLELGASHSARTATGWSPLLLAIHKGCFELSDLLMRLDGVNELGSHSAEKGWGALHLAVLSANSMLCSMIMKSGIETGREAVVTLSEGQVTSMTELQLAEVLN